MDELLKAEAEEGGLGTPETGGWIEESRIRDKRSELVNKWTKEDNNNLRIMGEGSREAKERRSIME